MLENQIALVTGASRGIGAAIAQALGKQGAVVIGTATTANGAEQITQALKQAGIKGAGMALDVNDAGQVEATLKGIAEKFGDVSILVNNAGVAVNAPIEDFRFEDYEHMLAVNVTGVFVATQEAARRMKAGGRIIHIGSSMTRFAPT